MNANQARRTAICRTSRRTLNYLAPMAERPRNYTFDPPPGVPRSNIDARGAYRADPRCAPVALGDLARSRGLRGAAPAERGARFLGRGRSAPCLLPGGRARAGRGDRREQGVHLRPHAAAPGEGRRRSCARRAAPAGDARARGPHREVRARSGCATSSATRRRRCCAVGCR